MVRPSRVSVRNRTGVRPHLDIRGEGGYVVAPLSFHASGRRYEWLTSPEDVPLALLAGDVLALLATPANAATSAVTGRLEGGAAGPLSVRQEPQTR